MGLLMSDAQKLAIIMEVLTRHFQNSKEPLCTRLIKEQSGGRLRGHEHEITPLLTREAKKSRVIQLPYLNQRDGFRYLLPEA